MVLTDREIAIAIQCQQLIIKPLPDPTFYSSTSLDLRLSSKGEKWLPKPGMPIRPGVAGYSYKSTGVFKQSIELTNYSFEPQQFILAWTEEFIELPLTSRLAARIEGKSSIARLGIGVHVTAPTIHCGFKGQIVLEMFNFGPNVIVLDQGLKICQLIFETTAGTPEAGYNGMFAGQTA